MGGESWGLSSVTPAAPVSVAGLLALSVTIPPMRVAHFHTGCVECLVDRSGVNTKLLADHDKKGATLGVQSRRPFCQFGGQLLAGT